MVKKGPCLHCGINYTPLWRNGPADKPVLCNACGARYKVKGHLDDDYLPKNVQFVKSIKNVHEHGATASATHLNLEDQLPNHVPPTGHGSSSSNISTPDDHHISSKDFGNKAPSRKRSRVEYQQQMMTPMEEFHKQLLDLYKKDEMEGKAPYPEDDLVDNVNNFIPNNEIGLGAILLKTDDHDVASADHPGSLTSSSTHNQAQCDQSSTTAPHHSAFFSF